MMGCTGAHLVAARALLGQGLHGQRGEGDLGPAAHQVERVDPGPAHGLPGVRPHHVRRRRGVEHPVCGVRARLEGRGGREAAVAVAAILLRGRGAAGVRRALLAGAGQQQAQERGGLGAGLAPLLRSFGSGAGGGVRWVGSPRSERPLAARGCQAGFAAAGVPTLPAPLTQISEAPWTSNVSRHHGPAGAGLGEDGGRLGGICCGVRSGGPLPGLHRLALRSKRSPRGTPRPASEVGHNGAPPAVNEPRERERATLGLQQAGCR
jgi:hypothetical protein